MELHVLPLGIGVASGSLSYLAGKALKKKHLKNAIEKERIAFSELDEPIIAYKSLLDFDSVLHSMQIGVPWNTKELVAECRTGYWHFAPAEDCRCGIYAWYRCPEMWAGTLVAVALTGDAFLHRDGFRGEKAEIVAILPGNVFGPIPSNPGSRVISTGWLPSSTMRLTSSSSPYEVSINKPNKEGLREKYAGVPLAQDREQLIQLALEHGSELPEKLIPQDTESMSQQGGRALRRRRK